MQINKWLRLSKSVFTAICVQKKEWTRKFPFIEINNWIVPSVTMSVKYFLPVIFPRYSGKVVEKRKRIKAIISAMPFKQTQKKLLWMYTENSPSFFLWKKNMPRDLSKKRHRYACFITVCASP